MENYKLLSDRLELLFLHNKKTVTVPINSVGEEIDKVISELAENGYFAFEDKEYTNMDGWAHIVVIKSSSPPPTP